MAAIANLVIPGFRCGATPAAIRKPGRLDLGLIAADRPCVAAGLFTQNRVKAPAVILSAQRLRRGYAQAILVNSGNANTCVPDGMSAAKAATAAIPALAASLRPDGWPDFARAIMTTDTRMKLFYRTAGRGRNTVTIAAAAKGAGMIMPNMATMLCYVLTDAELPAGALRQPLAAAAERSLNALTIDGDTSTSDSLILMASGASGVRVDGAARSARLFRAALDDLLLETAEAIAADGEGATRWFRVTVAGAATAAEADRVARRIANSPLVKTALHAADPNWGRILAAAGSAGVPLDPGRVSVRFEAVASSVPVARNGVLAADYNEAKAREILAGFGFTVRVSLGRGRASRTILGCDLSADYVRINAEYRT